MLYHLFLSVQAKHVDVGSAEVQVCGLILGSLVFVGQMRPQPTFSVQPHLMLVPLGFPPAVGHWGQRN